MVCCVCVLCACMCVRVCVCVCVCVCVSTAGSTRLLYEVHHDDRGRVYEESMIRVCGSTLIFVYFLMVVRRVTHQSRVWLR